jgi:nucleotide-binding universal stress UspA family protein
MWRENTEVHVDEEGAYGAGRVVVGVSGSVASLVALRAAADAARSSGRTLVAVHAWEPPEGEVLYLRNREPAWADHWQDFARHRLDRAFDEAFGGNPPGVTVRRVVVRDRPGRALCTVAGREGDLLVVGVARGRGGRVARYVRRRAVCALRTVLGPRRPRGVRRALRRVSVADFAPTASERGHVDRSAASRAERSDENGRRADSGRRSAE